jgi:hypothetical protein
MRAILCALALIGLGLFFLAPDASAAPSIPGLGVPVLADIPHVDQRRGWRGCDPCRTCQPRYPYFRPYYYRPYRSCRYPYHYRLRGCPPKARTGYYKRR